MADFLQEKAVRDVATQTEQLSAGNSKSSSAKGSSRDRHHTPGSSISSSKSVRPTQPSSTGDSCTPRSRDSRVAGGSVVTGRSRKEASTSISSSRGRHHSRQLRQSSQSGRSCGRSSGTEGSRKRERTPSNHSSSQEARGSLEEEEPAGGRSERGSAHSSSSHRDKRVCGSRTSPPPLPQEK